MCAECDKRSPNWRPKKKDKKNMLAIDNFRPGAQRRETTTLNKNSFHIPISKAQHNFTWAYGTVSCFSSCFSTCGALFLLLVVLLVFLAVFLILVL